MTREEALQHFKEQLDIFGGEHAEAIKVAIEALKAPPISQRSMYQAGYRQGREEALEREQSEDLISRAEAIEALGEEPPVWCDEEYEIAERNQWREDVEAIKSVPSADRPRGHWIDMADFEQCSECRGTHLKEVDTYYGKAIWIKTDFCPNCGADMRGEDE